MRIAVILILIILSVILHSSVQPAISQRFILGDLPVLVVICTGLFLGPAAGALTGFLTGLLNDLTLSSVVGIGLLTYTLVGYLAGIFEQNLKANERGVLALMVAFLTMSKYIMYGLLMSLAGLGTHVLPMLAISVWPAVVNGMLLFIVYNLLSSLAGQKIGQA